MPLQLLWTPLTRSLRSPPGRVQGHFGKDTDWKEWSQEMQDYCIQDVNVTKKLCDHFPPLPDWVALEHQVSQILTHSNFMDGILMNKLHGNLHLLSEDNLKILVNYYVTGILSSSDQALLLKSITDDTDTLKTVK